MTGAELQTYDEQLALGAAIAFPRDLAWELQDLSPDLFQAGPLREIARAVCALRDRHGTRWRWRHVVRLLRSTGRVGEADLSRRLCWAVGTSAGAPCAFSRLYQARALRQARRYPGHLRVPAVDFETRDPR